MKTTLIITTLLVCFILFSFAKPDLEKYLSKAGLQNSFKNYPKLGFEKVQSEHFELVKIDELKGEPLVDEVRYFPAKRSFLFTHASRSFYWKLDAHGDFIDSIHEKVELHSCGVFFHDNYYVDWALTGDSGKKPYKDKIDAESLSKEKFENYLTKANVIAYQFMVYNNPDKWYGRCLLKIQNDWIMIEKDLPFNEEGFDYFEDPERLTMQGHATKNDTAFHLVDNSIIPFYKWKDPSNQLTIRAFKKKKRIKRRFFSYDINNHARNNGWEGTGYLNWIVEQDTLKFQAYSFKITEFRFEDFNLSMGLFQVDALEQFAFLMVGASRGDRASEEIGLYVMRKTED